MATKRVNGEGCIRKRNATTWEARITVSRDPVTKKQKYKCFYGKSRKEVKAKMDAYLEQKEEQEQFAQAVADKVTAQSQAAEHEDDLFLSDWLDIWHKSYLSDIKLSTRGNYRSIIDNHIIPVLGNYRLSKLKAPAIQDFYNLLRDEKHLSPKYIKNIHGVLHSALDKAVEVEYAAKNYSSVCSIPKVEDPEIKPLNKQEQERLFAALKGEPFEDLILTDLFTGLRCGELIGLTWDCIDFDQGIIHVKKQLSMPRKKGGGGKCYWSSLKNGKTRIVVPAPFVMDVLKHHKAVQAAQKLAAGSLWDEGDFPGLVFTHPNGYHYIQPTIWKEFQKILKKAGLNHYRVHDLRHTFAVNSIKAGDDIKTLQENMGHYSAAFTLDKYGHVVDEMRKASSSRMQKLIESMSM
uniref:Putative site-specific recombinase n=1 Tax=uncultured bacterium Contigcl_1556 TaxID=1393652 RepID=W0FM39_9BACT|nr:putative site-specific recombinase [uncultured bacterium Contigcl_1556]